MISDKLHNREVYRNATGYTPEQFDKVAEAAINKHVRKLVLTIKCIEASGREPLDKIERRVIRAFEQAEYLYYGLGRHELMQAVEVAEREDSNDKRCKRNQQSI